LRGLLLANPVGGKEIVEREPERSRVRDEDREQL
jgi:hypothetical protein